MNVWKGMGAGFAGGLLAAGVMSGLHALIGSRGEQNQQQEEDSTVKTASGISEGLFRYRLTEDQKKIAGPAVHFLFGGAVGALYGGVSEYLPLIRAGAGVPYGAAVWLGAHVVAVPALGLSRPPTQEPVSKEAQEFGAHLIYGLTLELVRRLIRKRI